jgi:hypothetical protein
MGARFLTETVGSFKTCPGTKEGGNGKATYNYRYVGPVICAMTELTTR